DKALAYPWGQEFDEDLANTWLSGRRSTAPVGSYPLGASPFGVQDMAGNVFEWVDGFFAPYPGSGVRLSESEKRYRILRGGSWNFSEYYARTTHRFARPGGDKSRSFGFRLARDP
ncbi:MAG: formylglycine-generating enzyme family protein, partial [Candidatus Hinthialibacter sp.]